MEHSEAPPVRTTLHAIMRGRWHPGCQPVIARCLIDCWVLSERNRGDVLIDLDGGEWLHERTRSDITPVACQRAGAHEGGAANSVHGPIDDVDRGAFHDHVAALEVGHQDVEIGLSGIAGVVTAEIVVYQVAGPLQARSGCG